MSDDSAAYERRLSELLDGRISPEQAREVHDHLDECEVCRADYEAMRAARTALHAMPAPRVPEGLLASIKRDAARELSRPATATIWSRLRTPAFAAAAAAAIVLAVFAPWQALYEEEGCEGAFPSTEMSADVVASLPDEPAPETGVTDTNETAPEAEEEVVEAEEAARETVVAAAPVRRERPVRMRRASATDSTEPVTEEPQAAVEEQPVPEPELAWAPPKHEPVSARAEPVLDEATMPTVIALGPRTTTDPEPTLAPAQPSELETQMATGVVAGMLLDQFVAEHMVESSSTLLSVVTDTPTSELGPALADEDESGSFGLRFTDAMRRALTESENQLP